VDVDDDADSRIDPRELLDGQRGVEERPAAPAVRIRHLDAHQAQREQGPQQPGIEGLGLVHGSDERADLLVGEGPDAVAEQPLVFGERRKGRGRSLGCGDRLGHGLRGIMAEASTILRRERPCLAVRCARVS
jgi:hypothetical protein